jgi:hypothetical protein
MAHSVVLTGKHPYALLQRFSCRYVAIVAAVLCNRQRLVKCSYRRTSLQSIHHCGIALHRIASHFIALHCRFIAEHGGVGSPQVTPTWLAWRAAAACAVHTLKILCTAQPAMSHRFTLAFVSEWVRRCGNAAYSTPLGASVRSEL